MKTPIPVEEVMACLFEVLREEFDARVRELVQSPDQDMIIPEDWEPISLIKRGSGLPEIRVGLCPDRFSGNSVDMSFNPWAASADRIGVTGRVSYGTRLGAVLECTAYPAKFEWRCDMNSLQNFREVDALVMASRQQSLLAEMVAFAYQYVERLASDHEIVTLLMTNLRPSITINAEYSGSSRMWTVQSLVRIHGNEETDYALPDPTGELLLRFQSYLDTLSTSHRDWCEVLFNPNGVRVKGKARAMALAKGLQAVVYSTSFQAKMWPPAENPEFSDWMSRWVEAGCP